MPSTTETPTPYPLYNTTFHLHRVTPLYTKSSAPLTNATLAVHARHFRRLLVGDVLRDVRSGLAPADDDVLARIGELQNVTWRLLPTEDNWAGEVEAATRQAGGNDDVTGDGGVGRSRGILVTVAYERMVYTGILLRPTSTAASEEGRQKAKMLENFEHFPLLLTKMPAALRDTFTDCLASIFDVRVSALNLSGVYLTKAFETYISSLSQDVDGHVRSLDESSHTIRAIAKDVQVHLGFDLPDGSAPLKTVDIQITREDVPRLVARGRKIRGKAESPFMEALGTYINAHMALDIKHERVRVVRIACGAFVLGGEGRVKLTLPVGSEENTQARATVGLVEGLIDAARGGWLADGGVSP